MTDPVRGRGGGRNERPPGLDAATLLRMIGRELRHLATLGWGRRRQRSMPLVPGEVIVGWTESVDAEPSLGGRFVRAGSSWLAAGSARAYAVADLAPPAEVDLGRWHIRVRSWVLRCRPGAEAELIDALTRRARRWDRRREGPWKFGSFVATRVPWMRLESPDARIERIRFADRFDQAVLDVGLDQIVCGRGPVVVGVLDSGVNRAALARLGLEPPRITVDTWVRGRRGEPPFRRAPDLPAEGWHGTVVAAMIARLAPNATVRVFEARELDGDRVRNDELAASWLLTALHELRDVDLLNLSVSVDRGGRDVAPTFELLLANSLEQCAETRRMLAVAAAGNSASPGADGPRGMALPARDRHVAAVGSLTEAGTPWPGNRHGNKDGDLHWLMPGGTEAVPLAWVTDDDRPVYGTSFATAMFTAFLARGLSTLDRVGHERDLRAETLDAATQHTHPPPNGESADLWGRGVLRQRT